MYILGLIIMGIVTGIFIPIYQANTNSFDFKNLIIVVFLCIAWKIIYEKIQ